MEAAKLGEARRFVERFKANPSILTEDPSYAFFRDYLESLGVQFPLPSSSSSSRSKQKNSVETEEKLEEEEEEEEMVGSDDEVEHDDDDPPQKFPAASPESGSSSASAVVPANSSEVMVVGRPQPFTGHNIFEKGERSKYTKVKLPGLFKKQVKLWVNYGEMDLCVVEVKVDTETDVRNFEEGFTNLFDKCYNGVMFGLNLLTIKEKYKASAHPSGEESVLYRKVELPGIYGKAVKVWVKSDILICVGQEFKIPGRFKQCGSPYHDSLVLGFIPQSKE